MLKYHAHRFQENGVPRWPRLVQIFLIPLETSRYHQSSNTMSGAQISSLPA
jgi:hypothetical protein